MTGAWLPTTLELSGTAVILSVGYLVRRMMASLDRAMSDRWSAVDSALRDIKERMLSDSKTLRQEVRDIQRDKREHDHWARQQHEDINRRLSRVEGKLDLADVLKGADAS